VSAPQRIGLRVIYVRGNDGASGGHLGAHELRRHVIRNACAPSVAVRRAGAGAALAAGVLAQRDVLHLRGDDPGARIGELRHGRGAARPQRRAAHRELRRGFRPGGQPIVERLHPPAGVALDVAPRSDPGGARARQPLVDVDGDVRVGIGAGRIVDRQRRLARGRVQLDLPHRHAQSAMEAAGLIDLARRRQWLGHDLQQLRVHRMLLTYSRTIRRMPRGRKENRRLVKLSYASINWIRFGGSPRALSSSAVGLSAPCRGSPSSA
jgi:hypothetical protein